MHKFKIDGTTPAWVLNEGGGYERDDRTKADKAWEARQEAARYRIFNAATNAIFNAATNARYERSRVRAYLQTCRRSGSQPQLRSCGTLSTIIPPFRPVQCLLWVISAARASDVRFTPRSGHWNSLAKCPLCVKRHCGARLACSLSAKFRLKSRPSLRPALRKSFAAFAAAWNVA